MSGQDHDVARELLLEYFEPHQLATPLGVKAYARVTQALEHARREGAYDMRKLAAKAAASDDGITCKIIDLPLPEITPTGQKL